MADVQIPPESDDGDEDDRIESSALKLSLCDSDEAKFLQNAAWCYFSSHIHRRQLAVPDQDGRQFA